MIGCLSATGDLTAVSAHFLEHAASAPAATTVPDGSIAEGDKDSDKKKSPSKKKVLTDAEKETRRQVKMAKFEELRLRDKNRITGRYPEHWKAEYLVDEQTFEMMKVGQAEVKCPNCSQEFVRMVSPKLFLATKQPIIEHGFSL